MIKPETTSAGKMKVANPNNLRPCAAAMKAAGTLQLTYAGKPVDLAAPFERLTIREAILKHTGAGGELG